MSDTKNPTMTDAIALSQTMKDIYGKYLQAYDLHTHPNLENIPFPYVLDQVREEFGFFKLFKDNLGGNTPENIKRLMDEFYRPFKLHLGKSPLELEEKVRAHCRDEFARKYLTDKLKELKRTFCRDLLYPVKDMEGRIFLDNMYRLFIAPNKDNNTSWVLFRNESFDSYDICRLINNPSPSEIEAFKQEHYGKDINEFCYVYFPGWKYRWVKRKWISNRIFTLTAVKRYEIINIICKGDVELIKKCSKVFHLQPFDTEYHLFLCTKSIGNFGQGTMDYFNTVIKHMEEKDNA